MSVAIAVEGVSKRFVVRQNRPRTLRESMIRRLTGQHDPDHIVWALRDVSFEVKRGQTLGIIGHNGAGKSTLLRLLCGIGRPTSGAIHTSGPVSGLLQLAQFHPMLSGRENIRTAGMLSGLNRRQMVELEEEMIEFAELEEFIDQPVRTYSDGMSLRLAFSAAVHLNPKILLIDEILMVGDIEFKQKCSQRLKEFQEQGNTLILTSHSMGELELFCDEIMVLEQGKLVFRSEPKEAIKYYHNLMLKRTEKRAALLSSTAQIAVKKPESGSRMGTQEASITSVQLYKGEGHHARAFSPGAEIIIELDVNLIGPLNDLAITVGIFTETDVKCLEVSLPSVRNQLGPVNGAGRFRCRIPALHLMPGRYFANIGIYPTNWEYMYDYHWQMHPFEITGESQNISGIVFGKPVWSSAQ